MSKKTTKTAHVMSILTKSGAMGENAEAFVGSEHILDTPPLGSDRAVGTKGTVSETASEEFFQEQQTDIKISQTVQNGLMELLEEESRLIASNNPVVQSTVDNHTAITIPSSANKQPSSAMGIPAHQKTTGRDLPNGVPVKTSDFCEYIVVPAIAEKPTFAAPPAPSGAVEYNDDCQSPLQFNIAKNIKDFTPELFFDPADNDKFPDSYFTKKEKTKMDNNNMSKSLSEKESYICINVVEEITAAMLTDVMDRFGLCKCEKCKADVMAIALNDLTPKYVGTYRGQLFVKLAGYEKQYSTDVLSALTKACIHVKSNPRHD